MELCKASIFSLQLNTDPLQNNFILIQKEFEKVHRLINSLRSKNGATALYDSEGKQLSPLERSRLMQGQQNRTASISDHDRDRESYKARFGSLGNSENQICQQNGQTVLDLQRNNNSASQRKLASDHGSRLNANSRQSMQSSESNFRKNFASRETLKSNKSLIKGSNQPQSSQPDIRIANSLQKEIQNILQQLSQCRINDDSFKQKLEQIQKENAMFRKCLGLKKKGFKQKGKQNVGSQKGKSILKSRKNIEFEENKNTTSEKNMESKIDADSEEVQDAQFQGYRQVHEDIEKIRDYLAGKMKAIDTNFNEVNTKLANLERNIELCQRTEFTIKEDIQGLENKYNQTKTDLDCIQQSSSGKGRLKKNHQNSNDQSDGKQSYEQADIQVRLQNLFQQMQKLKNEYRAMFQSNQNLNDSADMSEQTLEKRKKLSSKLNGTADQKVKKQLHSCKRDLKKLRDQFDYLMNGLNTGSHQTKTFIIKPNENKQDWKSLSTKIYKCKQELQSQITELEGKVVVNNELSVVLNEFEVGIGECKAMLKRKLDTADFQKTTKRIENRLNNFIKQIFEKEGSYGEQDAIIAKQPWFCLSCDVELKNYTGKARNSSPVVKSGDKFIGKKVNPESHMVRRNQNGRLPSLAI